MWVQKDLKLPEGRHAVTEKDKMPEQHRIRVVQRFGNQVNITIFTTNMSYNLQYTQQLPLLLCVNDSKAR